MRMGRGSVGVGAVNTASRPCIRPCLPPLLTPLRAFTGLIDQRHSATPCGRLELGLSPAQTCRCWVGHYRAALSSSGVRPRTAVSAWALRQVITRRRKHNVSGFARNVQTGSMPQRDWRFTVVIWRKSECLWKIAAAPKPQACGLSGLSPTIHLIPTWCGPIPC